MKHVVIFEPIGSGASLVLAARKLGHDVTVVSLNDRDRRLPDPVLDNLNHLVEQDSNAQEATVAVLEELHRRKKIDAVIAGNEYYVPLVARIAQCLSLPGLDPERALALRNKHEMRKLLHQNAVRVPSFRLISSAEDISDLASSAFPLVLKPLAATGSFHVTKVTGPDELLQAYRRAQAEQHRELDHDIGRSMLLEEYLCGPEYSLEGYISDAGPVVLSITEKILGAEPNFVECGHIVRAPQQTPEHRALQDYLAVVIRALSLDLGVFHAELRWNRAGEPVLVEIAARLPGDRLVELIALAGGDDLAAFCVQAHLGQSLPSVGKRPNGAAAAVYFLPETRFAAENGSSGFRRLTAWDGYLDKSLRVNSTQVEQQEASDYRSRLGSALFRAESGAAVRRLISPCLE